MLSIIGEIVLPKIVCVITVAKGEIMQKFVNQGLLQLLQYFCLHFVQLLLPDALKQASAMVSIGEKTLTAVIDSGSSDSYISESIAKHLDLHIYPSTQDVSIALSSLKSHVVGHCYVDITLNKHVHPSCHLGILKNLCSNIILGQDFQKECRSVIIKYGGSKPELMIPKFISVCALSAASFEEPSLFANLCPDCKPIAGKL